MVLVIFILTSCRNLPYYLYDEFKEDALVIKYPVILVHGILIHDRSELISFWGRIPDVLENNGITYFFGNTDACGSIEVNAAELKNTIDRVLLETNSEKVNIIAHSKGGLDSRYLIWRYDYGDKVASLTTISTPHQGSEVADLVDQFKHEYTWLARRAFRIFEKLYWDQHPNIELAVYELTTGYLKEFNEIVTMDERVYYQSIYSSMKNPFDDIFFFYTFLYIKRLGGANDGLVSETSARWSPNYLKLYNISHTEITDLKMRKISGVNIPDVFLSLIKDLGEKGF